MEYYSVDPKTADFGPMTLRDRAIETGFKYRYDAHAPLDVKQLEWASNTLLELSTFYDFKIYQRVETSLIEFLEALARVRPYLADSDQGPVDTLMEIWQESKDRAAKVDEKLKGDKNKGDGPEFLKKQLTAGQQREAEMEKKREETKQRHLKEVQEQIAQDASIDEKKLPYSAWSLRESPQERLIAAARYTGNLQFLKIRLRDEPMLMELRPEAMQTLAEGDLRSIAAATSFLDAYKGQIEWEKENLDSGDKVKGKDTDTVDDLADSLDDFDLSEGEEEEDSGSDEESDSERSGSSK